MERDDVRCILNIVLSKIPMAQVDAALIVHIIGGHVLETNLIVNAMPWAAHGCYNIRSWSNSIWHMWANLHHLAKVFVTGNEVVIALRCHAIRCLIDFLVCAVNAYSQYLHQYALPIWNVRHFWHRYLFHMHPIGFTRIDRYRFHHLISLSSFQHQFSRTLMYCLFASY